MMKWKGKCGAEKGEYLTGKIVYLLSRDNCVVKWEGLWEKRSNCQGR